MTEQENLLLKTLLDKASKPQELKKSDRMDLYRLAVKQAGERGRRLAEAEKIFRQDEVQNQEETQKQDEILKVATG